MRAHHRKKDRKAMIHRKNIIGSGASKKNHRENMAGRNSKNRDTSKDDVENERVDQTYVSCESGNEDIKKRRREGGNELNKEGPKEEGNVRSGKNSEESWSMCGGKTTDSPGTDSERRRGREKEIVERREKGSESR